MGHEWNEVQLDGVWYEVDVTWDTSGYEPYGQGTPSSEKDHTYFLISDEIMSCDHYGQALFYACDSMAGNYYIMEGYADAWAEAMRSVVTAAAVPGETNRVGVRDVDDLGTLPEHTDERPDIVAADVAELLNGSESSVIRGIIYSMTVAHVPDEWQIAYISMTVSMEAQGYNLLSLPDDLTEIGANAFAGSAAFTVVKLPSGLQSIDSSAFDNREGLLFVVDDMDTYAAAWAQAAGYPVELTSYLDAY